MNHIKWKRTEKILLHHDEQDRICLPVPHYCQSGESPPSGDPVVLHGIISASIAEMKAAESSGSFFSGLFSGMGRRDAEFGERDPVARESSLVAFFRARW